MNKKVGEYDTLNTRITESKLLKEHSVPSRLLTSLFKQLNKVTMLCTLLFLVSACSSNQEPLQNKPAVTKTNSDVAPVTTEIEERTSISILNELKASPEYSLQKQRDLRIEAAYLALNEQYPMEAVTSIVEAIDPNIVTTLEQDINLASLYVTIDQIDNAQIIFSRLQQGVLPKQYQIPVRLLSAQINTKNEQHLTSIRSLFRLTQLYSSQFSSEQIRLSNALIWQNILNTPTETLAAFKYEFGDEADSWLTLAEVLNNFIDEPAMFTNTFSNWYANHRVFTSFQYLPDSIQLLAQSEPYQPKNIALLLPFSGKLAKQAEAIRNGFLAQNNFNTNTRLTLIDTNKHSIEAIEAIVTEQNVEFIVGPLLKETIVEFQTSDVLKSIPALNLNTISNAVKAPGKEQFFYALAPEDEIEQAVEYFLAKDIKNPALIYADNSLGRRLAQQFQLLWQQTTEQELESIAFKSKSKLGVAVKNLLDVGLSEKRINEIKSLFGNQIKSEQRSRTDIDAVYIIANSQQTRLIKPFFDVNVSTFGQRLPIYASSRSYVIGESRVEKRDLNGLIFTEMTWMLKDNNQNATNTYNIIGDTNTQLKKLFAFGYDARKLMPILKQLSILPEVRVQGLTGELWVTENQRVKRNLQWSQYQNGRVIVLQDIK